MLDFRIIPSGIYIIRLKIETGVKTKKTLIKKKNFYD